MSNNPYEPPPLPEESPRVVKAPRRPWKALFASALAVGILAACLYWLGFGMLRVIGAASGWESDAPVWWMLAMLLLPIVPGYLLVGFVGARWDMPELWENATALWAVMLAICGLCLVIGGYPR